MIMSNTHIEIHPLIIGEQASLTNFRHGPWRAVLWLAMRLMLVLQVARERRQLAELDDRMLKDIGLDRGHVHRETVRSMLDLPQHHGGRDCY